MSRNAVGLHAKDIQCSGWYNLLIDALSLAWCELYLMFAHLFLRYEVSIHETTDEDMIWTDHLLMLWVIIQASWSSRKY